jgi:hypothetical protein
MCAAGIGVAGQALGSFMLSNEMLGPKWRGVAGILLQVGHWCLFEGLNFVLCLILQSKAQVERRGWHPAAGTY